MRRVRPCLEPLLLAAMLGGCGAPVSPTPVPPPATPVVPSIAPSAAESPDPAPAYVMRGTLLGHDGKPMKLAHVHVGDQSTQVEANGRFRVKARGAGFLPVRFTGVDHADLVVSLYFDGHENDVEITLGTYERRAPPFAGASVDVYAVPEGGGAPTLLHFPRPVKKLANGLYGAVLLDRQEEIFYALEDVARCHRVTGAEAEGFAWDGRSYIGRLHRRDGAFRIVLDPAKMPPAGLRPRLRFVQPDSRAARLTSLRFEAISRAAAAPERGPRDPAWRAEIVKALANERDADIAAALRMTYLSPPTGLDTQREEAVAIARALLEQVPAEAPIWAFSPSAAPTAVELAGRSAERDAYLDRLLDGLGDRDTAATFVGERLRAASRAGRDGEVARQFEIMRTRFAGTTAAHGVAFYDPARRVRPDHELPDFDLPAMSDGARAPAGTRVTRASLRGKIALIDFWGFWCAPCVAEMGNLSDVFERYKDAGFTIVSVAVRTKPPAIRTFRASRWPMPWRHVVLDDRNQDDTLDRFEIKSYPSPILVDRKGRVIAAGDDLRGEGLERAVAAALRREP